MSRNDQLLELLDKLAIGIGLTLVVAYFVYQRLRGPRDDGPERDADHESDGPAGGAD